MSRKKSKAFVVLVLGLLFLGGMQGQAQVQPQVSRSPEKLPPEAKQAMECLLKGGEAIAMVFALLNNGHVMVFSLVDDERVLNKVISEPEPGQGYLRNEIITWFNLHDKPEACFQIGKKVVPTCWNTSEVVLVRENHMRGVTPTSGSATVDPCSEKQEVTDVAGLEGEAVSTESLESSTPEAR